MLKKRFVIFSSLFRRLKLVPIALLYQIKLIFGRLVLVLLAKGQVCVSLHPTDLDKVGYFRPLQKLAVGHEHVNERSLN
jgi:hypothetical protein